MKNIFVITFANGHIEEIAKPNLNAGRMLQNEAFEKNINN